MSLVPEGVPDKVPNPFPNKATLFRIPYVASSQFDRFEKKFRVPVGL